MGTYTISDPSENWVHHVETSITGNTLSVSAGTTGTSSLTAASSTPFTLQSGQTIALNGVGSIYCAPQTTTQEPQMNYDCKIGGSIISTSTPSWCIGNGGTLVPLNSTSTGANTMDSGSVMELGIAAILFAIAAAIVVGTRIFWLKEVGQATYTPIKPKK